MNVNAHGTYIFARFRTPQMLEVLYFAVGKILRVLQNDDIFALKICARNEILPINTTEKPTLASMGPKNCRAAGFAPSNSSV